MGNQEHQKLYRTWVTSAPGEVLGEAKMQLATTYIVRSQGEVFQWVALRPIFELFSRYQI